MTNITTPVVPESTAGKTRTAIASAINIASPSIMVVLYIGITLLTLAGSSTTTLLGALVYPATFIAFAGIIGVPLIILGIVLGAINLKRKLGKRSFNLAAVVGGGIALLLHFVGLIILIAGFSAAV